MQFFIITPFFLIAYCFMRAIGYISIGLIGIAGFITIGVLTDKYNLGPDMITDFFFSQGKYSLYLYFKPYARIAPYLLGLIFGLMYFEYKNQNKFVEFQRRASVRIF